MSRTAPNLKDISGQRFGLLAVKSRAGSRGGKARWSCLCDCGNEIVVHGDTLRRGQYSCGCVSFGRRTHNMSSTRVYKIWTGMIQRCTNPNVENYASYGGRGITVCDTWLKFDNFFADMGEPPERHSIERRDNNGHYEASNCYWLPMSKQPQNRRGNTYVEVSGETVCASEAARRLGVKCTTIRYRIKNKKDIAAPIGVSLTHNGETLRLYEWSERLGIRQSTINMRIKRGWPVGRVLGVSQ